VFHAAKALVGVPGAVEGVPLGVGVGVPEGVGVGVPPEAGVGVGVGAVYPETDDGSAWGV
jgi:hypothetical protein